MSAEVNSTRSTAVTRMISLAIFDPSRYDARDDDGSDSDATTLSRRNTLSSRMDGGVFSCPLTPAQVQVYHKLIDLADANGLVRATNRDLGDALRCDHRYASRRLLQLQQFGLLERFTLPDGQRVIRLFRDRFEAVSNGCAQGLDTAVSNGWTQGLDSEVSNGCAQGLDTGDYRGRKREGCLDGQTDLTTTSVCQSQDGGSPLDTPDRPGAKPDSKPKPTPEPTQPQPQPEPILEPASGPSEDRLATARRLLADCQSDTAVTFEVVTDGKLKPVIRSESQRRLWAERGPEWIQRLKAYRAEVVTILRGSPAKFQAELLPGAGPVPVVEPVSDDQLRERLAELVRLGEHHPELDAKILPLAAALAARIGCEKSDTVDFLSESLRFVARTWLTPDQIRGLLTDAETGTKRGKGRAMRFSKAMGAEMTAARQSRSPIQPRARTPQASPGRPSGPGSGERAP